MNDVKSVGQEEKVRSIFDEKSGIYAGWYDDDTTQGHSFRWRRKRVYDMLPPNISGKALDIGCGPGVTMDHLLKLGLEVWGVDVAEGMIQQCKERFGDSPKAHFQLGKIEELDFPENFFDVILCMGVVEYLADDALAIRQMHRVVKKGCPVIITCPNFWSPWRLWSHVHWGVKNPIKRMLGRPVYDTMFHREYSLSGYSAMLQANGFEVTDVAYYNFKMFFEPLCFWFPKQNIALSEKMEKHYNDSLRWLGTGFIVKAVKK